MKIKGLGIDIVNTKRVSSLIVRYGERFLKRVFTEKELSEINMMNVKPESIAGRFAGKEAVIKSLQIPFNLKSVEILHNQKNAPYVSSHSNVMISISHEVEYAVAFAIAYEMEG